MQRQHLQSVALLEIQAFEALANQQGPREQHTLDDRQLFVVGVRVGQEHVSLEVEALEVLYFQEIRAQPFDDQLITRLKFERG